MIDWIDSLFDRIFAMNPVLLSILFTLFFAGMAGMAFFMRMKASKRPLSVRKIIMPPVGMSTGFIMFIVPQTRIPLEGALIAFLVGWFLFAYPLILGTKFEQVGGDLFVKRSKSFIVILVVLIVIRLALHGYVERYVSLPQTGGVFFVLAFGMISHWRLNMLRRFKRMTGGSTGGGAQTGTAKA
ncbi:cytochrome c biogenesis protein CcdC [Saccharibacillus sp. CPCC 101409]|uniref:CcdC family protein n=1 Tax=Saccharibacillus sp. CPCC 101409 TaxID=3058041 RepID=UPI002672D710|nr:cytochrome c biogenesis protein CcdC [Saccharibacillus sp. CPCC 101409]MDO3411376.1 cytochrome c biogenesis protein CcdC [Saccharibacillus sp. CPCC 101409]